MNYCTPPTTIPLPPNPTPLLNFCKITFGSNYITKAVVFGVSASFTIY